MAVIASELELNASNLGSAHKPHGSGGPLPLHSGELMLRTRLCGVDHSGRPAFRRPSSYLARSSGRYGPNTSLRLETRNAGSICRKRAQAFLASSAQPRSALLAALILNAGWESGRSCNVIRAQDDASP